MYIWIILYNITLTNTQTTKYKRLNDQLRDTCIVKIGSDCEFNNGGN